MAYHVYTTRGIVLGALAIREADKIYAILTEDLGLVHARARGVRLAQSKLRGALEPFSLTSVSLIRGKESWRLTGAVLVERLDEQILGKLGQVVFARIFALTLRLVAGEESHKELFVVLYDGLNYVIKGGKEDISVLEVLIVLRLLHELGYVSASRLKRQFISVPFSDELMRAAKEEKKDLITLINQGLQSSNLV